MRRTGVAGVLCVALAVTGCSADDEPAPASTPSSAPAFAPGAEGIGDAYFPKYGNGGYDVAGYDLKLRFDPKTDELSGTATITATATQDLSRFNFDLSKLAARNVTVDGVRASSKAEGTELVVTPARRVKPPKFEDTDRWARGRVIASLLQEKEIPLQGERLERALAGLERDGLIVRDAGGRPHLP